MWGAGGRRQGLLRTVGSFGSSDTLQAPSHHGAKVNLVAPLGARPARGRDPPGRAAKWGTPGHVRDIGVSLCTSHPVPARMCPSVTLREGGRERAQLGWRWKPAARLAGTQTPERVFAPSRRSGLCGRASGHRSAPSKPLLPLPGLTCRPAPSSRTGYVCAQEAGLATAPLGTQP